MSFNSVYNFRLGLRSFSCGTEKQMDLKVSCLCWHWISVAQVRLQVLTCNQVKIYNILQQPIAQYFL